MTPGESIVREGSDIGIVDIGECLFTAWLLTLFRPRMAEELTNRMSEDHILLNQLCRFRATRLPDRANRRYRSGGMSNPETPHPAQLVRSGR